MIKSKKMSFFIVVMISLYFFFEMLSTKFIIPSSPSVNGFLFYLSDKTNKEDYVVFKYTKKPYKDYKNGKLFIKRNGCDSGQYLKIKDLKIYCDDTYLATAFVMNEQREILDKIDFEGIIPQDQFFALGEHKYSYDSRYFGLVEKKDIKYSARRLF